MDILEALEKVFLFRDVPAPVLKLLAECVERRSVPAGDAVITEGERVESLFLIASGEVRAFREGEPQILRMGTGQSFGQLWLLQGGVPATLSVVSIERTELLVLRAARVSELLAGNDAAGHALFRAVARSLAARLQRAADALALARDASA
jgi:CRP-like cAMP-binding protein